MRVEHLEDKKTNDPYQNDAKDFLLQKFHGHPKSQFQVDQNNLI